MAGIYIHIPFCAKQCAYCDFHFSTTYGPYRAQMLECLEKELWMRSQSPPDEPIETLYFGGGTPSLLSGEEVARLIEQTKLAFRCVELKEVTLECNPDDCSEENLRSWKAAGVNRLSIGIQSFTETQLEWMNRTHSAQEGMEALGRARDAGFDLLTVDLMYGLPDLTLDLWQQQLEQVIALGVEHVSAYCLTVEERTPLAKWVKSGKIHPPGADQQSEQFECLVRTLAAAGFEQYEISNFARNKRYSMHNTSYWTGNQYVGIGPSAHGFDGVSRVWNVANNQQYMRRIAEGELPETREVLTGYDRFNELLLVGLRTQWGTDKSKLLALLTPSNDWWKNLERWKQSGHLLETETHYILTPEGRLLADGIASDLFELDV